MGQKSLRTTAWT